MKRTLIPLLICLCAAPVAAQDKPPGDVDEGVSLMQEGAKLLLKGLMSNMEPTLQEMGRAITDLQPALQDLFVMMGDVTKYHAPEMLENGDIIIRRKTAADLPPVAPEIDL